MAFERSELGEVSRFEGELTATILQAFAREQGAHSPKAKCIPGEGWLLTSSVALPMHLSKYCERLGSDDSWKDLMQDVGYEVPASKPKQPSILNFRADEIKGQSWGSIETFKQITLTKDEYKAVYDDYRGVRVSECGQFKFRFCRDPKHRGGHGAPWFAVFLSDSKIHDAPDSESIIYNTEAA